MSFQRLSLLAVVVGGALLTQWACGGGNKSTNPNGNNPAAPVFQRLPATEPVVSSGRAGWPIFPTDPCVLADSEGYHLFYTSYFCSAQGSYNYSWDAGNLGACDITHSVSTIGYAFSSDQGLTWQFRGRPVVLPGSEPWQSGDLETPFAIIVGDSLVLFYSATGAFQGQPFPQRYQIGAAVLDLQGATIRQKLLAQGADFARLTQPLLPYNTVTSAFNNNTQEPSAIIRDGKIELFYVGVRFSQPQLPAEAPGQSIIDYGLSRAVFTTNLTLVENASNYTLPNANITEVKYYDSAYHVFATSTTSGGEFHQQDHPTYYYSRDGITFSEPVTLLNPGVDFDSWGAMAPTVVVGSDSLVLFYTGWSYTDHPCFQEPLPVDVRFGRPSNNDAACIYGAIGRATAKR